MVIDPAVFFPKHQGTKLQKANDEPPGGTLANAIAPGICKAYYLKPNASLSDRYNAYGEASFDAALFIPGLLKSASSLFTLKAAGTIEAIAGRIASNAAEGVASVAERTAAEFVKQTGRKRFTPNLNAKGAHTRFRKHGETGKITHFEEFKPQTYPYNPNPWESVKRFDSNGQHFNTVLKKYIEAPHVHDPCCPGGIRPALTWEIPRG
jgi:hypothetical protein